MPNEKIYAMRRKLRRRRTRKRAEKRAKARRLRRNEPAGAIEKVQATARQTKKLADEMGMSKMFSGDGDRDRSLMGLGERSERLAGRDDHDEGDLLDLGSGGQEASNSGVKVFDDRPVGDAMEDDEFWF